MDRPFEVTLQFVQDTEQESHPSTWDWTALLDSAHPVKVVKVVRLEALDER